MPTSGFRYFFKYRCTVCVIKSLAHEIFVVILVFTHIKIKSKTGLKIRISKNEDDTRG